ncbi:16S rRNA (uracil1498-N3)-methyltransferase [Ruminococcus sp. YE71]|uniref:RsmE family RNA methyltransferase n=1 Tax=unclassified Ruminococcus TaxID=2608920 RepID=UPI0008914DDF|nr:MULTISPECIES: RsmE family RNA methyltransferase [unclassified Ruminococcus]SDA14376.1 16S rRNA (uracil1498-N3)-methyltransferase [Ruminococcus sp. YE78]SFW20945.1 16S rRNA (uracil1498-N3)-methyltransferase [Ruminococcus sp. YE71]
MTRSFNGSVADGRVLVTGDDARHIALSLRMRVGESIIVCREGIDYLCELESITPDAVEGRVVSSQPCEAEADIRLHLFQAVPKGEKAEIIVQKSVELGVYDITFMLTERCISRPDGKSFGKKLNRYNRIALEAAKQSGRGIVPEVRGLITLEEAAVEASKSDTVVWCYEKGGASFGSLGLKSGTDIALLIGSEGGFSDGEAEKLMEMGMKPIGMGKRILRCETAPLAAASIIMNLTGNM